MEVIYNSPSSLFLVSFTFNAKVGLSHFAVRAVVFGFHMYVFALKPKVSYDVRCYWSTECASGILLLLLLNECLTYEHIL